MTDAGFYWDPSPTEAIGQMVDDLVWSIRYSVRALMLSYAGEIEAWMKANAAWDDQTGNARQTLQAELEELADAFVLKLDHGMTYGKWLELIQGGAYAITGPAVDEFAPRIFADLRRVLS